MQKRVYYSILIFLLVIFFLFVLFFFDKTITGKILFIIGEKEVKEGKGGKVAGSCIYEIEIYAPEKIELEQGEKHNFSVTITNMGCPISSVNLTIEGIDTAWYWTLPTSIDNILENENATFNLFLNIPENASIKEYSCLYKFSAKEASFTKNFSLIIREKEIPPGPIQIILWEKPRKPMAPLILILVVLFVFVIIIVLIILILRKILKKEKKEEKKREVEEEGIESKLLSQ